MILVNKNGDKRELVSPSEIEIFKQAGWVEEVKPEEPKKTTKKKEDK